MVTDKSKFIKKQYNIRELAKFKLCPALYAYSITEPDKMPHSRDRRQLVIEAKILVKAFEDFAEESIRRRRSYYKKTSKCLWHFSRHIAKCTKNYFEENPSSAPDIVARTIAHLNDKAKQITDGMARRVKSSRFKIVRGEKTVYPVGDCEFIHYHPYMVKDSKFNITRSVPVYEYLDFPVFSAGDYLGIPPRYMDMILSLAEEDPAADRVGMALKIIQKINIQIESGFYTEDGLERVSAICKEIAEYDFGNPEMKKSMFCKKCKYRSYCADENDKN